MAAETFSARRLPLLLLLLVLPRFPSQKHKTTDVINNFHDPEVDRMNHLVVDKNTGRVYVGAVNRLYQLAPDLNLVVKVVTGPKKDNPDCSMMDCPKDVEKKLTDNVNKALVIDYTTSKLISCGSLFQVRN